MDIADDELETLKARTIDRLHRSLIALVAGIGRDHQPCGKAACARSHRCRGFACEPDIGEDKNEASAL
jgi:hypothetical protein